MSVFTRGASQGLLAATLLLLFTTKAFLFASYALRKLFVLLLTSRKRIYNIFHCILCHDSRYLILNSVLNKNGNDLRRLHKRSLMELFSETTAENA